MDFVVELPKSSDFNAVIIVVDSISKSAYFILTYTTMTAEGTVRLFLYYVWKLHSLPNHIVLNRDLQFVILFTQELYYLLEIEIILFIAYYL